MTTGKTTRSTWGPAVLTLCLLLVMAPPLWAAPRVLDGEVNQQAGYMVAGPSGATIEIAAGVVVHVGKGSSVRVLPSVQHLSLPLSGRSRVHTLVLRSGLARAEIDPTQAPHEAIVVVTLDQMSGIAVTGETSFSVTPGGLWVANVDGSVLGPRHGNWESIPLGEVRYFTSTNEPPRVSAILPAPVWEREQLLVITPPTGIAASPVVWKPVDGATGYEVVLHIEGEDDRHVRTSDTHLPGSMRVPPGRHQVQCRAIDARGIPGRLSRPLQIRAVKLELPAGARFDPNGVVALGPGQTVAFDGAEGFVMWHHPTHRTVPATTPVGLYRGKRTVVALRAPGSLEFALVRLEPRRTSALVEVGPKNALWPHDPIRIRYRLDDGNGNPPSDIQETARVTIDTEPVEVNWRREGQWRVARLRPRHGCVRCVVRVDVEDQYGLPLGRDFVEVVGLEHRASTVAVQSEHAVP